MQKVGEGFFFFFRPKNFLLSEEGCSLENIQDVSACFYFHFSFLEHEKSKYINPLNPRQFTYMYR